MKSWVWVVIGILVLLLVAWFFYAPISFEIDDRNVTNDVITTNTDEVTYMSLSLTSTAFAQGERIPEKHSCDGEIVPPPLSVSGVPQDAASLVLLMTDPDIPQEVKETKGIEIFDHWALFNIAPDVTEIAVDSGTIGVNSLGKNVYEGPCPPPQYQPTEHRYFFNLYALDSMLDLEAGVTQAEVRAAMEGHILEEAELMGTYDRS